MRRRLLFALMPLTVLLAACGDGESRGGPGSLAADDPVGAWQVDWEASLPMIDKALQASMQEAPPEQREAMKPYREQIVAKMRATPVEVHVESGGTFRASFPGKSGPESAEGTWRKVAGGIELTTKRSNGKPVEAGSQDAQPVTARFDGGKLVLTVDEESGMGFVLRRS